MIKKLFEKLNKIHVLLAGSTFYPMDKNKERVMKLVALIYFICSLVSLIPGILLGVTWGIAGLALIIGSFIIGPRLKAKDKNYIELEEKEDEKEKKIWQKSISELLELNQTVSREDTQKGKVWHPYGETANFMFAIGIYGIVFSIVWSL